MLISNSQKTIFFSLIILIGIGVIGYAVYKSNQKLVDSALWVDHTKQVIYQSGNILSLAKDLETASQGFVITNDSSFIEPMVTAEKSTFEYIRLLKELTKDNLSQQKRIDSLYFYMHKHLDFSFKLVELRTKEGLASAITFTSNKQGKQYTTHIRQISNEIQKEEKNLLKQRTETNEDNVIAFNRFLAGMFVLMVLLTILLIIVIRNFLMQDKEKEKKAIELVIANNELKQSERLLKDSLKEMSDYKDALDESTIIAITDQKGIIKKVNSNFCKISKYNEEELIGQDHRIINSGYHSKEFIRDLWTTIANGKIWKGEIKNKAKDGSFYWVDTTIVPFINEEGKPHQYLAIRADITKRKESEEELTAANVELDFQNKQKEKRAAELIIANYARSLIEASLDPLVTINATGKILDVNEASVKVTGVPREKLIDTDFSNYFTEPKKAEEGYQQVFEKGFVADYPLTIKHKNGNLTDVLYNASVYKDYKGNVLGVFAAARDVTEQKKSSQYARSLIEASLDPLVTISIAGKILDVNEASVKVTGVPREKLIDTDFSNYFTEPIKAQEGYRQVFEKSFVADYPLTIRHTNGHLTDVLYNASVYKDSNGNVLGVFAAARDITEQKQASQYARSLLEASLDPLVTISSDGKITDVNEASVNVTGIQREKLIGTNFSTYFTEPKKAEEGYQQVFEKGFVADYPLTIRHTKGHLTDVLYNASVYKDSNGNVLGVFAAVRDVTEQKRAVELIIDNKKLLIQNEEKEKRADELMMMNIELKKAEDDIGKLNDELEQKVNLRTTQLETVNKELESFSYSVAHDLRAPLRAIHGYTLMLKEDNGTLFNDESKRVMDNIMNNSKKMGQLIDDLLSFSRLGRKELAMKMVSMSEMVTSLCNEMKNENKNRVIEFHINELQPANVDIVAIKQVWENLISNAVKYSKLKEKAIIEISSETEENKIKYSIKDNGAGFDMRYVNKLFGVFQRLHSDDKFEGTGVGLAIVHRIITKHGGNVWAEGKVNEGATFYFTLPKNK